jgi:hypothetical protein
MATYQKDLRLHSLKRNNNFNSTTKINLIICSIETVPIHPQSLFLCAFNPKYDIQHQGMIDFKKKSCCLCVS